MMVLVLTKMRLDGEPVEAPRLPIIVDSRDATARVLDITPIDLADGAWICSDLQELPYPPLGAVLAADVTLENVLAWAES